MLWVIQTEPNWTRGAAPPPKSGQKHQTASKRKGPQRACQWQKGIKLNGPQFASTSNMLDPN